MKIYTLTEAAWPTQRINWGLWCALAVVLGIGLVVAGIPSLYFISAIAAIGAFAAIAARVPNYVTVASLVALILVPYFMGVTNGVLPKLFADETLLLLYVAACPALYLFGVRSWKPGFSSLYWLLILYLGLESASFYVSVRDLIALRNFAETCGLGAILLVLFLQESANNRGEQAVAETIVWITVIIAIASVAERIYQKNPLLEQYSESISPNVLSPIYLSPLIVRLAGGAYRPYASFFHPSEAGTFMAMSIPFVISRWKKDPGIVSALFGLCVVAGLLVNATRGAWVAAALVTMVMVRNTWKIIAVLLPTSATGGAVAFIFFHDSPFMQRITDPNNFLARFVYWRLGWSVFMDHPILGVGHMQFITVYLGYVADVADNLRIDLNQVGVLDNIYLTSLAEHGVIGFAGLVCLFIFLAVQLHRSKAELSRRADSVGASFVLCTQLALGAYVVSGCFADVTLFTKVTKYLFILVGISLGIGAKDPSPQLDGAPNSQGWSVSSSAALERSRNDLANQVLNAQ